MIIRSDDGLDDDILLRASGVGLCYRSRRKHGGSREFWPFRDLTFDIKKGETLGIIGGNGAGKSTLMRVLAGLVQPDEGTLQVRRNITVQLLTIGLGFEARLTGRENALLSGVLLGKSTSFMRESLDAIKQYSELGDFFEKAVYTYSSGMKARLGFSVAMRVDPEILLLDEVMGVGDAAFRDKSSQAISEMVFREGKTVVIISHNARTIKDTCSRALWIGDGRVMASGAASGVTESYLEHIHTPVGSGGARGGEFVDAESESPDGNLATDHLSGPRFISESRHLIEVGKFEEASNLARERLSRSENGVRELVAIADALLQNGDFDELVGLGENVLDSEEYDLNLLLGLASFGACDLRGAIEYFRRAIRNAPGRHHGYLWAARMNGLAGDAVRARFFYQQAVSRNTRLFSSELGVAPEVLAEEPLEVIADDLIADALKGTDLRESVRAAYLYEFTGRGIDGLRILDSLDRNTRIPSDRDSTIKFINLLMLNKEFGRALEKLRVLNDSDRTHLRTKLSMEYCRRVLKKMD